MKVSSSHDGLLYLLVLTIYLLPASDTAPVLEDGTAMQTLDGGSGCYYNFEHYYEGDRILTNEPCLNCTCHNRMLMCYLRVCPFTKGIGQDCTVEKKPDQCCPVITCPQVPVALLTSSTTQQPPSTTALGRPDNYGCVLNQNTFYPDGAQVPSDPKKPCELCYCIRNHTACVMQECTLNVEGCKPVFQEGICCPVRYDCDYEDALTTQRPTTVGLVTTAGGPTDCLHDGSVYHDGEMVTIDNKQPCEHCYCMRGDIVCAVQECGTPLEGSDCTPLEPPPEQCCPTTYQCANGTIPIKGHGTEEGNQVKETPDHTVDEASVEEQSEEDKDKHDKNDESSQSEESEEDNASHEQSHPETSSISSIDKHPDHEEVEQDQTAIEQVDELQSGVTAGSSVVTSEPKVETVEEENESTSASESPSQDKNEEDTSESSTSVHSLLEQDEVQSKPEVHLEEESASEAPNEQEVEKETDSAHTQEDNVKQTSESSKPEEEFITEKPTERPVTILSEDQENASHHPNMEDSESQSSVVQSVAGEVPEDVVTVEEQNNNHLATNEIPEIISTPVQPVSNEQARVPGEGSCLVDGKTYPPDSDVPPSPDSCHKSCKCVNSIVQCERVECSLPPSNYANCMPVQTPDSCCPTYMCDQAPSDAPEIQNQLSIDKIDTNLNEEGTMVEEQHGEHQTSASVSEDESATTSGQIDEVQTVPPVVISGIPPENLVPGADDEITPQPGPSEENLIANNEDSTSSASSDSSVSQHVNEVNNVDHNQEIPISPIKTDESAIHEGSPEEITEHDHGKPVENNLVDSQNQHHQIVAGSEGGTEEQSHNEDSALHNNNPTLIYDDFSTTENNIGLSEVGSDVHTEVLSEHTVGEQEQQNKGSEVNGSVNEEMTENEEVAEQHTFHDELGEAHENKHEVDQEITTYPQIGDHPVQGQSQEVTSQGQSQPEPFTDHGVPSNWEGYTTEGPNQPLKHSESPTVDTTEVDLNLEEFEQKEPVKESTTSDHIPEGTPSPQHETNILEFESPGIIPHPVEEPERGTSEKDEFTTMKTYETEQILNQNGEIETVITHTESTESDLHLNEDEHHQESSDNSHTVSTDEHSSSSEHTEEEAQDEINNDSEHSSMNEGNTEVVGSEHEEILTVTEQSHMPDSIHEQVQQEHDHVSAEDSSPVDSTAAEESHDEHSHDSDAHVEDQHLIPTESSEINSYTDSTEEQHSEKYPEYISHEHSSPSEHAGEEEVSTETAHESEHSIVHGGNTEEILTATEQTHTPDTIHEVYGGNTISPADLSSQAPSTTSPVTDDGHYLEENSENGDEKMATDKPSVVEDIPSPIGNHEELPTKEEEVTEANSEVTADYSSESTELGVIKGSHVTDTYEEAHVTNIDEEDKKQHVPDNIHEDSTLESETSTTEHQQPEHEQPEHQLPEHEQPEHQLPEHEQEHQLPEHEQEHQLLEHEQPEHQLPEPEQPEHQLPEHEQPDHQLPEHEQPEQQLPEHEQPDHQLPEHEQPEHQLPEHEQPEHQLPEHEQPEHQLPEHEQPGHQLPEHEQPEHQLLEHEQPEYQLPEHEQPEHQLPEHEQPEHEQPEHQLPEHQLPEHEQPEHQLPEHEQPEHQLPEHEQPEYQLPEHEQSEHQLPEHEQPEQQTEEVTHIELHEDVPVSSITSEDHRITEEESDEHSDHHHHMDNVNPVVDDTIHENYDYTTDNVVKPTSQEDSSPSESVNIDHSGNENSEVHENHDDQENDPLEGSADLINNNNGLLGSTVPPAIISEQEHLFPEGNIDTEKPVQEADVEYTKEEVTTENFHLFDLSTPSHQVLPITPGPPGIDVSDIIHKEESSTNKEYEPEGSTEHWESNVATSLESHTGEPSLEETTNENVPEEVEEEQKKDIVHPEVTSETHLESEVPDKEEHTEHVTDEIKNNETSDDAGESSTHISLDEGHVGESISSELPTVEGESVSESIPAVVESDEKHVTEGVSQGEDNLESEHHIGTDQTQLHKDELHEADLTHNAYVPTETIDVTTNAGVSVEDTATSAENVHEADSSKVPENVSPEKEEDEGQIGENVTSHRDDTESEHKEPAVHEGFEESVTELEKIHEESTESVDTHDELSPTSVVDKDEISSAAVGEQAVQGGETASSFDVETETGSHDEKLEEPVKEEHTEKVDVAEHTVSSSDSDNENLFVNHLESSSSRTPASDNQVLETTGQHFDENTVEPVTDHYSATEISSTGESHTDDSSLTSDAKPGHPDIHNQVPAVDENLTEPASEVSISAAHQEGEVHSDTYTEPSTDSALEGSGLEETSSFPAVPIESQSIPESGFETATSLETMFGSSSPETSTSGDSDFHQEPISQTSSLSHEVATDKPEDVKQDHVPEDSTKLTSETSTAGVHAETESSHLKPQEPVKEPTESSSEIVLEGHVSETVTHSAETTAPPSSTEKVTQGQQVHEEHITTTSPHQTSYIPIEQTSPVQGIHHHESVAGIHPSAPLFPGWTQKPFEHHTTSEPPPHLPEDSHYPSGFEQDYEDDDGASYGPGTCRYGGKVYLSAQQIPRDDPCDFCFCFRSDIICLQQSCPPPIKGCYQETIKGFCCPRYECHVSMATMLNITTTTTTTTTTLPPHFFAHAYKGAAMKAGCQVKGVAYNVGDRIPTTSGPCLQCRCGANGQMKCEPTVCGPQEALLRQVMDAAAISKRR